jgi:DNA ligase D-like protein (predicted 3'-phosphoesterase)
VAAKYVIQEHHASHLHWDLRLEHTNLALSWAVPKMPTNDTGIKRLAVRVEDHNVTYMDFEGTIAEGEYGAGTVNIWDKGTWEPESITEKKIVGLIHGNKLNGRFTLLNFKDKNWLFMRNPEK